MLYDGNCVDSIINPVPECRHIRVSVQGVKSLGGHFACLCRGFDFYEVKKIIIFQKEKGNVFTLLIIFIVKRSSKRAK